jgi:hypothetical protein
VSGAIETAAAAPAPRAAEALQRDNAHGHFETKAGVEISTEQAPATTRKKQQQPNDARHVRLKRLSWLQQPNFKHATWSCPAAHRATEWASSLIWLSARARTHARTRARAHARTHARTEAQKHARTSARAHARSAR